MNISHEDDGLRQQLIMNLSDQFVIQENLYTYGNREYKFWSLVDPNSLLDEATLEAPHEQLEWQPYWGQLWDASHGMCHELVQMNVSGLSVLDLGCGLGIVGAVAASLGAQVLLADNAPPALEFARLNCWPWRSQVSIELVDWTNDDLGRKFDLILGADIIYDSATLAELSVFFRKHTNAGSRILLSEPSRAMTNDLIKTICGLGWRSSQKVGQVSGVETRIRFFELIPQIEHVVQ